MGTAMIVEVRTYQLKPGTLAEAEKRFAALPRDKARRHYDFDDRPCRYDDLLSIAPPDAMARRRAGIDAIQERFRDSIAAAALDAPIAIGVYYGPTIRNPRLDLDWIGYLPGYRTPALTGIGLCFASFR